MDFSRDTPLTSAFRGYLVSTRYIQSPTALIAGLLRPKMTFRQRNLLYCEFEWREVSAVELEGLEAKATKLGDYILAGRLMQEEDATWME